MSVFRWYSTQRHTAALHRGQWIPAYCHQVGSCQWISVYCHQASYLADDCRLVADARERRLRSTASRTCVVMRTHSTFGDSAFAAAGPGLWNSLPSHLKDADLSYSEFWRSLKTFLFGQWGHGAVWTVLTAPSRNILKYLLTYLLTYLGNHIAMDNVLLLLWLLLTLFF